MYTVERFADELRGALAPLGKTPGPLCVALSGGLDSTVLLVSLARARPAGLPSIRAIHVDHALHADSAAWSRSCEDLCAAWSVPLERVRVDARHGVGESPEDSARRARYEALRQRLQPGEVLLTAHHADDQLETILLQWLRGGGLAAVAGMSRLTAFGGHAWLARPLLAFGRDELLQWARAQGLRWIEDPSNADRCLDRSYLRHEVLVPLRARWPAAARTAARVAGYARESLELEAGVAAEDLAGLLRGRALDVQGLLALQEPRQRAAVRAWLAGCGLPPPPSRTLASLLHDVAAAAPDRNPRTGWGGAFVSRYRGCLHAGCAGEVADRGEGVEWRAPQATPLAWGGGGLRLVADVGQGLSQSGLPPVLRVATRDGGEQFVPAGGSIRRPLRKWLQERGVLPWRRAGLPLLFDADGRLVAVADLGCSAEFAARPGEPSWRVQWDGRGTVTESDAFGLRWPADPPIR